MPLQKYKLRCESNGLALPKVVYSDNPPADSRLFKEIFGEHVAVLKDPFHMLQDIFSTCRKKHTLFYQCMTEASNIIFPCVDVVDLALAKRKYEDHLTRLGLFDEARFPDDSFFKKSCRRFMPLCDDKDGLQQLHDKLAAWRAKWGARSCSENQYNSMFHRDGKETDIVLRTLRNPR